jgi:hypothetical protein
MVMNVQFGQVIHVTSDRGNAKAVGQITEELNNAKFNEKALFIGASNVDRLKPGEQPRTVILDKTDTVDFLNKAYGIHPAYIPPNECTKISELAAMAPLDPGINRFLGDIVAYTRTGDDRVMSKLFAYAAEKVATNTPDATGRPVVNIVV